MSVYMVVANNIHHASMLTQIPGALCKACSYPYGHKPLEIETGLRSHLGL